MNHQSLKLLKTEDGLDAELRLIRNGQEIPLTTFFNSREVQCKCGFCKRSFVSMLLLRKLDHVRLKCGRPMVINSFYRCYRRNTMVGGATDSNHMYGVAADISYAFLSDYERDFMKTELIDQGLRIIEYKDEQFFHVDLGPSYVDA